MIVLVAQSDDTLARRLKHELLEQDYTVCMFTWSDIMYRQGLSWWVPSQPHDSKSHFLNGKAAVPFLEIQGMMVLPSGALGFPSEQAWQVADQDYIYKEASAAILGILHSMPCPVINLPLAGGRPRLFFTSRRSREFLSRCRMRLPPTTVMATAHEERVRWPKGSGRIRVGSLDDVKRARLGFLENGRDEGAETTIPEPVFVQEVPAGEIYHFVLVGDSILGGNVLSENFDGSFHTNVEMGDGPPDLKQACLDLSKLFGLIFSECLVVRTPDGLWYCLDWNDSPQLTHWSNPLQESVVSKLIDLFRYGSVLP